MRALRLRSAIGAFLIRSFFEIAILDFIMSFVKYSFGFPDHVVHPVLVDSRLAPELGVLEEQVLFAGNQLALFEFYHVVCHIN